MLFCAADAVWRDIILAVKLSKGHDQYTGATCANISTLSAVVNPAANMRDDAMRMAMQFGRCPMEWYG
jgi:hypothetical protein